MSNDFVQLETRYLLDENWKFSADIPPKEELDGLLKRRDLFFVAKKKGLAKRWTASEKEELTRLFIRSIRIEVAEAAETKEIGSDSKYDYLNSEIGMNIILPIGSIAEMRFYVTLVAKDGVVAIDGFPKDVIEETAIVDGKIEVKISKAFKFIPIVGHYIGELLDIELKPWEFKLGSLRRVKVDFSGGLTSNPEWYFKGDGIKNDLRVALTIRKPKGIRDIKGKVRAAWLYDPGIFKKERAGTDEKTVKIF